MGLFLAPLTRMRTSRTLDLVGEVFVPAGKANKSAYHLSVVVGGGYRTAPKINARAFLLSVDLLHGSNRM